MLLSPLVTAVVSDLCATGDHDCEQVCVSSPGSYTCACREGFTLNSDGKTCNGQWAGHRQPGEGGGEGMGPWPVPRKLTRASLLLASGPICNGCLLWTCGHRGGRPCLGLLEGRVCLEPAPGPSGRVWTERQGSSGRRSHTGAWPQLGWPRRLGGVREEQPDFSPRQTFSPHLWLPLVEPTQEQSRRQPGNRKTHSYRREEESGTEDDEPPAHQRPDCTLLFAAAGQRGAGATQRKAWGSGHSAGPLGYGLMGPNRNVSTPGLPILHHLSEFAQTHVR